ncbi:Cysteine/Histidine-rich C1 domain family protein [Gossypium australe]|uniref:Cysteine/Histidine-rich C1 domain family protein n=1 Tax=Gossypium australe TaxID=47621 RepID=A0A5B6WYC1_9ROSI|nr:Cysteine/Histidine-rich C1 domain family protein [Gossypium australe]
MEDDSEQNYCDICEEERDLEDHVYYCIECQGYFVAHINCMLNSEEEIAAEGSSNMALDFPSTSAGLRERVCPLMNRRKMMKLALTNIQRKMIKATAMIIQRKMIKATVMIIQRKKISCVIALADEKNNVIKEIIIT